MRLDADRIAAFSIGAARRSLEDAIAYMKQRDAFGRPVSAFQALRHRVADLATDIAATRAFVYDLAQAIDDGHEDGLARESSMAKMRATEVAKNAALEAMQLMGGAGYAREYGMEFQVRRALAPPIFGGTNEIQREIIAKTLTAASAGTGTTTIATGRTRRSPDRPPRPS
jgi:acyl-CoA dehydrogenase